MAQYLPFWPKAAVAANVTGANQTENVYTKALPTNGFTEVVGQLECDATPVGLTANAFIRVTPQISNDGVNWQSLTAPDIFADITTGTTPYPHQETIKLTTIAAFLRYEIMFDDTDTASAIVATLMISAAGRS